MRHNGAAAGAREPLWQRDSDFSKMRYWRLINPGALNWVGKPAGFKLEASN
jgi:hypothetical protein